MRYREETREIFHVKKCVCKTQTEFIGMETIAVSTRSSSRLCVDKVSDMR